MKNIKRNLIVVIAAFFLITLTTMRADAATRKIVFIGDSYSRTCVRDGKAQTGWPYLVAKNLGITSADYIVSANPGYGFSTRAPYGNQFITRLASYKRDTTVTDVVLAAGMNDWRYDKKTIAADMAKYTKAINQKYPNARKYIAFIGWAGSNTKLQKILVDRAGVYKATGKALGWTWLEGPQKALYNRKGVFANDGLHPNQNGEVLIANAITKAFVAVAKPASKTANTLRTSISATTVSRKALAASASGIKVKFSVSNAYGTLHFKSSNETWAPISQNGVITFKKGCPKGTYYFRLIADGDWTHMPKKVIYTVTVN